MHELSLSSAIVNTAVKHAAGRKVTAVVLRVGRMRQVIPDTLDFYFGVVARDTVCEGARLEQKLVPAVLSCEACGRSWEIEFPDFRCPSCEQGGTKVVTGNEFEVESIDVEEVECIA
jgi:hydrogenase nickel incorporation protein HypA/HybF